MVLFVFMVLSSLPLFMRIKLGWFFNFWNESQALYNAKVAVIVLPFTYC